MAAAEAGDPLPARPKPAGALRIATWNINSVRLRRDLVLRLIDEAAPDLLCLQETKVPDGLFPLAPFQERGYRWSALAGMKGYNGVAILSRQPLAAVAVHDHCGRTDCRHVAATIAEGPGAGIEVHNLYVPSGGDVPDPDANDKFAHKLAFIGEMANWWPTRTAADPPRVLVGDLNIAPLENDVWSHKQMLDVVSHTPVEVAGLAAMQASLDWVDAIRRFVPEDRKLYSWWSYRARDWVASDRGRRLDHIWVTPPLADRVASAAVLRPARGWAPKPSDHVPVWVDLAP